MLWWLQNERTDRQTHTHRCGTAIIRFAIGNSSNVIKREFKSSSLASRFQFLFSIISYDCYTSTVATLSAVLSCSIWRTFQPYSVRVVNGEFSTLISSLKRRRILPSLLPPPPLPFSRLSALRNQPNYLYYKYH